MKTVKKSLTSLFIALSIFAGSMTLAPSKAQAGIILLPVGLIAGSAAIVTTGLYTSAIGGTLGVAGGVAGFIKGDEDGLAFGLMSILIGGAIVVLDENGSQLNEPQTDFELEPYVTYEIHRIASIKAQTTEADENGVKEVIFSQEEADSVINLLDDDIAKERVEALRSTLTRPLSL